MIKSIELVDFLSHSDTKLEFKEGVTIFVGENGAGKSSIIDAITYALFGKHTRAGGKSVIRRGTNQGYVKIEFSIRDKQYEAFRKIKNKDSNYLEAKFFETTNNNRIEIASGERMKYNESMTAEIEKIIGMNYEKLKIASIVQQGQLNEIIDSGPASRQELINSIIGIDKLDIASKYMLENIKKFREKIRIDLEYDDTHIEILERDFIQYQKNIDETGPKKIELELKQKQIQIKLEKLEKELEIEKPKINKITQLEEQKQNFLSYVKKKIEEIKQKISDNERKIHNCIGCFEKIKLKEDFKLKIDEIEGAHKVTLNEIQEMTNEIASLTEQQILASKLQLKDNKCPVCDSTVQKLKPIFQKEHIKEKIIKLKEDSESKKKEKDLNLKKIKEFSDELKEIEKAETILRTHSIENEDGLIKIQEETKNLNKKLLLSSNNDLKQKSEIDDYAKNLFKKILELESETRGFNQEKISQLKQKIEQEKEAERQNNQEIGSVSATSILAENHIKKIQEKISELKKVRKYILKLEKIEKNIFNKKGSVSISLRSWALNSISLKASEYLSYLNTKIQRISLSEKDITCYSNTEVLDLKSLSGGESVIIALALRLGMSSLLGASNLNLMILDEPTTHLDAERKKSLVKVLSQFSEISNSLSPMQFLIITHDEEIFEGSNVEQIYKFESSEEGTKVSLVK